MGRPEIKRSEAIAELVLSESKAGTPQEEIAIMVGISPGTLRKLYAPELSLGRCQAKSAVRRKIYDLCMEGNPQMLIFYAKTQLGWKERQPEPPERDNKDALKKLLEVYANEGSQDAAALSLPE